jgi:hypothetical protein
VRTASGSGTFRKVLDGRYRRPYSLGRSRR